MLTTRSGRRELLLYDGDDPDACLAVVHLDPEDSVVLADLLGASRVSDTSTSLTEIEGLAIDRLTVAAGSSVVGSTIGTARIRETTGANVVAIVRARAPMPRRAPRTSCSVATCSSPVERPTPPPAANAILRG